MGCSLEHAIKVQPERLLTSPVSMSFWTKPIPLVGLLWLTTIRA